MLTLFIGYLIAGLIVTLAELIGSKIYKFSPEPIWVPIARGLLWPAVLIGLLVHAVSIVRVRLQARRRANQ